MAIPRHLKMQRPSKVQLRLWSRLEKTKVREETGLFLAEGFKIVQALLESGWDVSALLILEGREERWAAFCDTLPGFLPCYGVTEKEWKGLTQDVSPEGILAVGIIPPRRPLSDLLSGEREGPLLLLHEISNPGNLGALVRSACWFGFSGMILGEGSVDPLNPKVVRTAMGSLFQMPFLSGVSLRELLPTMKALFHVVGSSVRTGHLPHPCGVKTALLLGSESHGLPDDLLKMTDEEWHIPRRGGGESLSLPQAAAILMYEIVRTVPSGR